MVTRELSALLAAGPGGGALLPDPTCAQGSPIYKTGVHLYLGDSQPGSPVNSPEMFKKYVHLGPRHPNPDGANRKWVGPRH